MLHNESIFAISIFLIFNGVSAKVLTFININDKNLKCVVTDTFSDSNALYLSPPDLNINRSLTVLTKWVIDDWKQTTTREKLFSPVTDIRWEGFEIFKERTITLNQKRTSLSMCLDSGVLYLKLFAQGQSKLINLNHKTSHSSCQWSHYIIDENKIFQVEYLNKTIQQDKIGEVNSPLNHMILNQATYIKKHEYEFRSSDTVTVNKISYIDLSQISEQSDKKLCISIFVSVDVNCYLDIILKTANISKTTTVEGFNNPNEFKTWKEKKIKIDKFDGDGKLFFSRGTRNGQKHGYWAIDRVHLCQPEIDICSTALTQENYLCQTLSVTETDETIFCDTFGYLGRNCSLNCQDVLGFDLKTCQNYKVCLENGKCQCAWGYQGVQCNEPCSKNTWGLNCASQFNESRCESHNNVEGCIKCKDRFFGNQCSKKLPVLLKGPNLVSISDTTVEIGLRDLNYGADEETPEYLQIQYKKKNDSLFKNHSDLKAFDQKIRDETITFQNLSTRNFEYAFRVLLMVDNMTYENVVQLVTHKKTLTVSSINNSFAELEWSPTIFKDAKKHFFVRYECVECCPNEIHNKNINTTGYTVNIKNFQLYSSCLVKLYLNDELIDEVLVKSPDAKKRNQNKLPKTIYFSNDAIVMNFENYFQETLRFFVNYTCTSSWCKNKWATTQITLTPRQTRAQENVNIMPFTEYEVKVILMTSEDTVFINQRIKSPPSRPLPIQNLSMFKSERNTIWLRWQDNYPPKGDIEVYNISYIDESYNEQFLTISGNQKCEIWKNFTCATIENLKIESSYNITVKAKNVNVLEWSNARQIQVNTKHKVSGAPRNLRIMLFDQTAIILTWNHPYYTHGQLKKFYIQVDVHNNSIIYNMTLSKSTQNYEYKISVEYNKDYILTVWGEGLENGEKKSVNATVLAPCQTFSENPFIEWCSDSCYLLVPKSPDAKFDHVVIRNSYAFRINKNEIMKDSDKEIFSTNYHWLLKLNSSVENVTPGKDHKYKMQLIQIDDSIPIDVFPVDCKQVIKNGISTSLVVTITLMLLLVISFFMFITFIYIKHRNRNKDRSEDREEGIPFLEFNELDKNLNIPTKKRIVEEFNNLKKLPQYVRNDWNKVFLQNPEKKSINDNEHASRVFMNLQSQSAKENFSAAFNYIVTKVPTDNNTTEDFWWMIWQENVRFIVMIADFTENGEQLFKNYSDFLQTGTKNYGNVTVTTHDGEDSYDNWIRYFTISYGAKPREIIHFQLKWNCDFTTNIQYPDKLAKQIKLIISEMKSREKGDYFNSPIVVYSRSGVDGPGSFILCHTAAESTQYNATGSVDLYTLANQLLNQRPFISQKYYILTNLIYLEYELSSIKPNFVKTLMHKVLSEDKIIEQENKYLESYLSIDKIFRSLRPQSEERETSMLLTVQNNFFLFKEGIGDGCHEFWQEVAIKRIKSVAILNPMHHKPKKGEVIEYRDITNNNKHILSLLRRKLIPHSCCIESLLVNTLGDLKMKVFNLVEPWNSLKRQTIINIINIIRKQFDEGPIVIGWETSEKWEGQGLNESVLFALLLNTFDKYDKGESIDISGFLRDVKRSASEETNINIDTETLMKSSCDIIHSYCKQKSRIF